MAFSTDYPAATGASAASDYFLLVGKTQKYYSKPTSQFSMKTSISNISTPPSPSGSGAISAGKAAKSQKSMNTAKSGG